MMDVSKLIDDLERGKRHEYLLFWGHRSPSGGTVTKSCFSQWFDAPFDSGGNRYRTAEHFMMAHKAALFGDLEIRNEVLAADDPGKAKALGRHVKNFVEDVWVQHRWDIVVQANVLKFGQHDRLRRYLLGTAPKVLVEASPLDAIWGIGLSAQAPEATDPRKWKGLNLLGFALMEVRERLASMPPAIPSDGRFPGRIVGRKRNAGS